MNGQSDLGGPVMKTWFGAAHGMAILVGVGLWCMNGASSPPPAQAATTSAPTPPVCFGTEGHVSAERFMTPPPDGNVMDNVLSHEVLITRREGDVSVVQEMIRTRRFSRIAPMLAANRFFVVQNDTRARVLAISGKHLKVRFARADSYYGTEGWIPSKFFELKQ